jgi:maleylacetoacetate isomerase
MTIRLYDYSRSSACYRVRIALNLKGLDYEAVDTSLIDNAHKSQAFVPMVEVGTVRLTQSLAIIEWLDASYPEPQLIPSNPADRAHIMALAYVIACDIHPINNLRILRYLKSDMAQEQAAVDNWYRHWIAEGFAALEAMADPTKPFLSGDAPGIADICLVPQMANARRSDTPLEAYPHLIRIDALCNTLTPFKTAHPDAVHAQLN